MLWQRGTTFNPWRDLQRLQQEMDRLFTRMDEPSVGEFPALNVWTSAEDAVLTAELPGVESKDLEISVVGDTVTVRGARTPEEVGKDATIHRRERGFGEFSRTLRIPFTIDAEKVDARLDKGVLRLRLPRAEVDRPRRISVQ